MSGRADAATLRHLADALDRMAETTAQTGVSLCPHGRTHIEIDGITLYLDTTTDGDTTQYVIDLGE